MNLITDLGAEIAFAILVEKRHNEKIKAKDILPLISRFGEALNHIVEKKEEDGLRLPDRNLAQSRAH